jgi:hypothetical protein
MEKNTNKEAAENLGTKKAIGQEELDSEALPLKNQSIQESDSSDNNSGPGVSPAKALKDSTIK